MAKAKLILVTVLALAVLIVVMQNTQAVETKILFLSFTMPRALLLVSTTLVGFLLGVLVTFRQTRKGPRGR